MATRARSTHGAAAPHVQLLTGLLVGLWLAALLLVHLLGASRGERLLVSHGEVLLALGLVALALRCHARGVQLLLPFLLLFLALALELFILPGAGRLARAASLDGGAAEPAVWLARAALLADTVKAAALALFIAVRPPAARGAGRP